MTHPLSLGLVNVALIAVLVVACASIAIWQSTERVQAWWAVLQVRQLQRLCLEALYCVVERWIAQRETDGGSQALEDCVAQLAVSGHAYLHDDVREGLAQMEEVFREIQGAQRSLYEAAAQWKPENTDDENEADG